jgi:glucokinase
VPDRRAVVAVDLGGTTVKAGVVGPGGLAILERSPTRRDQGPDAVVDAVASCAADLVDRARASGLEVIATGVTVPGVVDEERGIGLLSVTLGWRDLDIGRRLRDRLEPPVVLQHDVRAAARAEHAFGAAASARVALFVAIGTGLAAATLVDGRMLDGATGQAGEIGQLLVLDPAGTGRAVTLEDVASARGIADRYARLGGATDRELDPGADAEQVVTRAAAGDPLAAQVWGDAVDALAGALASAIVVVDPDVVVIGGGVSRAGEHLLDPLRRGMAERLPWRSLPSTEVARFGGDAGFVGAALAAWSRADPAGPGALAPVLGPVGWPSVRSAAAVVSG